MWLSWRDVDKYSNTVFITQYFGDIDWCSPYAFPKIMIIKRYVSGVTADRIYYICG